MRPVQSWIPHCACSALRALLCLTALFCSGTLAAVDGQWVDPVSWDDPEGLWVDVPLAYDGSSASYAADVSNRAGDGPWLILDFAQPIRTNRVFLIADFGFDIVDAVSLEARVGGAWTPLYTGAIANDSDAIVEVPTVTTDQIRFRFHYLCNGYYFWLYDFSAFALPDVVVAPQVATSAATAVTATTAALHGSVLSDGGEPCAYRFQYKPVGAADSIDTAWTGAVVSGQGGSSVLLPVTGLQGGVAYTYHMQAQNSVGVATGADVTFTPQPVPLGSVEWLPASDVSPEPVAGMVWDSPVNALDDDLATVARCYHPLWAEQWGPYLDLALPAVEIDHVRLSAGVNPYIDAVAVDIQQADGSWTPVYQGAFADRAWQVYALPARGTYPQARVRFHVTTTGVGTNWELFEFQVRMPPLVSFAAGADVAVNAAGHVDLPLQMQPATSTLPVTLTLAAGGTAVLGTDWQASGVPGQLVIPAGTPAPSIGVEVLTVTGTGSVTGTVMVAGADAGRIADPAEATVTINRSGGGGGGGGGDGLPPVVPQVSLAIVSGLTGDGVITTADGQLSFSNADSIQVQVTATPGQAGDTIASVSVAGGGTEATGAAGESLTMTLSEGRQDLVATAVATRNGLSTSGVSAPVAIQVRRTLRGVTWSVELPDAGGRQPLRCAATGDADVVFLNANPEVENVHLRSDRGWNTYGADGFVVVASDPDGLGWSTNPQALTARAAPASGTAVDLVAAAQAESSGTVARITGFASMPDSLAFTADTLQPTGLKGAWLLTAHLTDRCGNSADVPAMRLWLDRDPPHAQPGKLPVQRFDTTQPFAVAPDGMVEVWPARWLVTTWDVAEAWQITNGVRTPLRRQLATTDGLPTSVAGLSLAAWRVNVALPGTVTIDLRDFAGNRLGALPAGTQAVTYQRRNLAGPDVSTPTPQSVAWRTTVEPPWFTRIDTFPNPYQPGLNRYWEVINNNSASSDLSMTDRNAPPGLIGFSPPPAPILQQADLPQLPTEELCGGSVLYGLGYQNLSYSGGVLHGIIRSSGRQIVADQTYVDLYTRWPNNWQYMYPPMPIFPPYAVGQTISTSGPTSWLAAPGSSNGQLVVPNATGALTLTPRIMNVPPSWAVGAQSVAVQVADATTHRTVIDPDLPTDMMIVGLWKHWTVRGDVSETVGGYPSSTYGNSTDVEHLLVSHALKTRRIDTGRQARLGFGLALATTGGLDQQVVVPVSGSDSSLSGTLPITRGSVAPGLFRVAYEDLGPMLPGRRVPVKTYAPGQNWGYASMYQGSTYDYLTVTPTAANTVFTDLQPQNTSWWDTVGFRQGSLLQLVDDVVAAGGRSTVRIRGGFLVDGQDIDSIGSIAPQVSFVDAQRHADTLARLAPGRAAVEPAVAQAAAAQTASEAESARINALRNECSGRIGALSAIAGPYAGSAVNGIMIQQAGYDVQLSDLATQLTGLRSAKRQAIRAAIAGYIDIATTELSTFQTQLAATQDPVLQADYTRCIGVAQARTSALQTASQSLAQQPDNQTLHDDSYAAMAAAWSNYANDIAHANITVAGARLHAVGANASICQELELDIDVGATVRATLYDVDINFGAIHAYTDDLSQQYAGANGAHRMKEALKIFKPDIVPTVPKFAECLKKRSGKADEPVIIMTSGGDKTVSDCSLVGTEEGDKNVWSFTAKYDSPVFTGDTGTYAVVWDLGGGQVTAGAAGSGQSGGTSTVTVKYHAGQYKPTLKVYRTANSQTALVGTAAIHTINVYSQSVDGAAWTVTPVAEDDRYGSETKLERKTDEGVGINVHVGVDVKAQGTCRARISPDGYPQNEYWVTAGDSGDLPQPYAFKPESTTKGWTQGYGAPSAARDDLSVRIKASKNYGDDTTDAKFTALMLDLALDANRDHHIDFPQGDPTTGSLVDNDATHPGRPYRFWLNDNRDEWGAIQDPVYGDRYCEVSGDPSKGLDKDADVISWRRDLEDFFPADQRLSGPSDVMQEITSNLQAHPGIKSKSGSDGQLRVVQRRCTDASAYLTDVNTENSSGQTDEAHARSLVTSQSAYQSLNYTEPSPVGDTSSVNEWSKKVGSVGGGTNFVFPLDSLSNPSQRLVRWQSASGANGASGNTIGWLMEGVKPGKVALVGTLKIPGSSGNPDIQLHSRTVWVELSSLSHWYWRISCDPANLNEFGGAPTQAYVKQSADNWVNNETDEYRFLHVHGYNMNPWEKKANAETSFKRMWWNGFKGRFIAFEWPTCYTVTTGLLAGAYPAAIGDPKFTINGYGGSERAGFLSGEKLAGILPGLLNVAGNGPLSAFAHSHGNVVVTNALSLNPTAGVDSYVASQAAVPCQWLGNDMSQVMSQVTYIAGIAANAATPPSVTISPTTNDWANFWAGFAGNSRSGISTPALDLGYFSQLRGAQKRINIYNTNDWALGMWVWEYAGLGKPLPDFPGNGKVFAYMNEATPYDYQVANAQHNAGLTPGSASYIPFGAPDLDGNKGKRFGVFTNMGGTLTPYPWDDSLANPFYLPGQINAPHAFRRGIDEGPNVDIAAPTTDSLNIRRYNLMALAIQPRWQAQGRNQLVDQQTTESPNVFNIWENKGVVDVGYNPNKFNERRYGHHMWHSGEYNSMIQEQCTYWQNVMRTMGIQTSPLLSGGP